MINCLKFFHRSYFSARNQKRILISIILLSVLMEFILYNYNSIDNCTMIFADNIKLTLENFEHYRLYLIQFLTNIVLPLCQLLYIGCFIICRSYKFNLLKSLRLQGYSNCTIIASLYLYAVSFAIITILGFAALELGSFALLSGQLSRDYLFIFICGTIRCCLIAVAHIALMLFFAVLLHGNYFSLLPQIIILGNSYSNIFNWFEALLRFNKFNTPLLNFLHLINFTEWNNFDFVFAPSTLNYSPDNFAVINYEINFPFSIGGQIFQSLIILCISGLLFAFASKVFQKQDL